MATWAQIDENNIVIQVVVGDNDDPNGDEGYQWLIDNLGGRWIKSSYNSWGGIHYLPSDKRDEEGQRIPSGQPHLRYNFAQVGGTYDEEADAFIPPKPPNFELPNNVKFEYTLDKTTYLWKLKRI